VLPPCATPLCYLLVLPLCATFVLTNLQSRQPESRSLRGTKQPDVFWAGLREVMPEEPSSGPGERPYWWRTQRPDGKSSSWHQIHQPETMDPFQTRVPGLKVPSHRRLSGRHPVFYAHALTPRAGVSPHSREGLRGQRRPRQTLPICITRGKRAYRAR
jgi:hypothetical protein